MRCEPRHCRLRYTFYASPMSSESGYDIQNAFPAEYRDSRHCSRPDYPFAYIVANPQRHVVISPFPLNAALFIPNLAQPLDEVIGRGIAAELHGGRDLPVGARWLKQQDESIGVMKIRFVGRMVNRPVREPIACLDDRREPETKGCMRVDSRQDI